jgi:putative heme iron utilization protein
MSAVQREAMALVEAQRWAALAVVDAGSPAVSMVAYAVDADRTALLFFVSHLARHTGVLLESGRAGLAISAPDDGRSDPQTLPRLSLGCRVEALARDDAAFAGAAALYVRRFPEAAGRFELGDFVLIRLIPEEVRYVGGFARAASFSWDQLRSAAPD